MITKAHARILRKKIEELALPMTDADAYSVPELFPMWKADTEYAVGNRVQYESTLYKCLQTHTSQSTWTPTDSPSLWVRVDDPTVEFPEWIQPTGAVDSYAKDSKVSHSGKHWISDVDNNVWMPGVYGWTEVN